MPMVEKYNNLLNNFRSYKDKKPALEGLNIEKNNIN